MKLLVVESEDWVRELVVPWLREAGYQVVTCGGPQPPDLDCAGPVRTGGGGVRWPRMRI